MKTELTKSEQIIKSYDYITNVLCMQRKILPFEYIYGDGTIHGQLTKSEVRQLYETMIESIKS